MIPMKWRLDGGALSASKPSCNESTNNVYSMLARADKKFTKAYGKHKAFHKGGNSSCCMHICQHYELYIQKCKKADIPISHWAIPLNIWRVMEEEKEAKMQGKLTKKQQQQELSFQTVTGPCDFMRAAVLPAVTWLIATNNQLSC